MSSSIVIAVLLRVKKSPIRIIGYALLNAIIESLRYCTLQLNNPLNGIAEIYFIVFSIIFPIRYYSTFYIRDCPLPYIHIVLLQIPIVYLPCDKGCTL